jgi:glycopeptide antibiotics resistance protein
VIRSPGQAGAPWLIVTARVLAAVTVVVIALIVFTPGPPDASGQQWLRMWLDQVHRTWMPGWITFGLVEFCANVLLFAPLGLFGALSLRERRWRVLPLLAAASGVIELVQRLALPQREASWLDVLANVIGAAAGYGLALLVARASQRRGLPLRPAECA